MRDRIGDIRARGAELVVVGNGAAHFATAFREEQGLDCPLLVDPELRAYRAAGMRRGHVEALSPRLPLNALRALFDGHRQRGIQGDPWQLGGVLVIRPDGALTFRRLSSEAGDHPPVEAILAALAPGAPTVPEHPAAGRGWHWLGRALGLAVDPTVALSFDRTGFAIHSLTFAGEDLDVDLSERRCLVTGANSGIGFETALALADLGAEVILLCRNRERGEQAAASVREQTGNPRVGLEVVDVASLESVRAAATRLGTRAVDVLVHNAGTLSERRVETAEGLELTWATHVVGPHLLTALLRPRLEQSPDARVVWVSSGGMYTRRLNVSDPDWRSRRYDGLVAYAEAKRAQVVLAELWAERLRATGVVVNAMHPGWADTPGVRVSLPGFHRLTRAMLRTPAEGADTVVWLAAAARARQWTGRFFFDRTPRWTHFLPLTIETREDRSALWRLCEEQSGCAVAPAVAPADERAGSMNRGEA